MPELLAARRRPCSDCPWRTDAPLRHFPPDAFERLAHTAKDMDRGIFQCHDTTDEVPLACAGFLERGADHNLTVRLAYMNGRLTRSDRSGGCDLYPDFRTMAEANGVPPDHPALNGCRPPA